MLTSIEKNFKGTCYMQGKKGHKKEYCPQKTIRKKAKGINKTCSKNDINMSIVWLKKKMQAKGLRTRRARAKAEELEWKSYLQNLSSYLLPSVEKICKSLNEETDVRKEVMKTIEKLLIIPSPVNFWKRLSMLMSWMTTNW